MQCTHALSAEEKKKTNVVIFAAFVTGLSSLAINASSVEVGYLWEYPRLENVDTSEVVMDKEHSRSILRLICDITPPLPQDGEHWDRRDEIVKWYKTAPKTEPVKSVRYWSNDMSKTAISFSNITLDTLGTYSCIYGDVSVSIDVLGEEVNGRVREKFYYPLVLLTSTILNLVVLNPGILVEKVELETRNSKTIGHLMFLITLLPL